MAKVALDALAALPERGTCELPSPVVDGEIIVFLSDDEMTVAIVVAVVAGEVLNPTKTINQCAEAKEIPQGGWFWKNIQVQVYITPTGHPQPLLNTCSVVT